MNFSTLPRTAGETASKRQVAFLVLGAQAATRVQRTIDDIEAPRGRQLALAPVGGKHRVENVEHRHVLEDAAVPAMRHEGSPGFQHQVVAGHSAIRADQFDGGQVAVKRAPVVQAGGRQQF